MSAASDGVGIDVSTVRDMAMYFINTGRTYPAHTLRPWPVRTRRMRRPYFGVWSEELALGDAQHGPHNICLAFSALTGEAFYAPGTSTDYDMGTTDWKDE